MTSNQGIKRSLWITWLVCFFNSFHVGEDWLSELGRGTEKWYENGSLSSFWFPPKRFPRTCGEIQPSSILVGYQGYLWHSFLWRTFSSQCGNSTDVSVWAVRERFRCKRHDKLLSQRLSKAGGVLKKNGRWVLPWWSQLSRGEKSVDCWKPPLSKNKKHVIWRNDWGFKF